MTFSRHLSELRKRIIYSLSMRSQWRFHRRVRFEVLINFIISHHQALYRSQTPSTRACRHASAEYLNTYILSAFIRYRSCFTRFLYQVWLFALPRLSTNTTQKRHDWICFLDGFLFLQGSPLATSCTLPSSCGFLVTTFQGPVSSIKPMSTGNELFLTWCCWCCFRWARFELRSDFLPVAFRHRQRRKFLWKNFRYAILIIAGSWPGGPPS